MPLWGRRSRVSRKRPKTKLVKKCHDSACLRRVAFLKKALQKNCPVAPSLGSLPHGEAPAKRQAPHANACNRYFAPVYSIFSNGWSPCRAAGGEGTHVGDGRYYTYPQFFAVLFLTLLLAGIAIRGVLSHYQGYRRGGRLIMAAHASLGMAVFMRFSAEVVASQELALAARQGELICLLASELAVLYLMGLGSSLSPTLFRGIALCFLPVTGLFMTEGTWLVRSHTLTAIEFGAGYLSVTAALLCLSLLTALASPTRYGPLLLYGLPLGGHLAGALGGGPAGDLSLYALYPCLLAGLSRFSTAFRSYRIGGQAFSCINNLIEDAVLLCDADKKIVYRNAHARKAAFLKGELASVPDGGPGEMVSDEMRPTHRYHIPTFSSADGKRHIECRTQPVGHDAKSRFFIFTDISRHLGMLDLQEEQRVRLEEANQRLRQYAHIVFDMEKEKEVASLLSDVTRAQDTFITHFKTRLRALSHGREEDAFHDRIEALIADARENLSRIRALVARYRRYHGT